MTEGKKLNLHTIPFMQLLIKIFIDRMLFPKKYTNVY